MSGDTERLSEKIQALKREKKAIILAHNYQRPEVQDIADYVDDSVGLARRAMEERDARVIIHCSVDFMAQTAVLLNPDKRVYIPSLGARCPMATMLPASQVKIYRRKYPGIPIVLYVNTHAEVKALCDICCTSANAVKVVESLNTDEVILGPDVNLAAYVERKTGKKIIPLPEYSFCQTHILFAKYDLLRAKKKYPGSVLIVHPECTPDVQDIADFVGSTSQMCRYVRRSNARCFIVGTELGLIHRLDKENPDKTFIPGYQDAWCVNMRRNDLEKIYLTLKEGCNPVTVDRVVAAKARRSLERMFEVMDK